MMGSEGVLVLTKLKMETFELVGLWGLLLTSATQKGKSKMDLGALLS